MKTRVWLAVVGTVALGGVLAACGGGIEADAGGDEGTEATAVYDELNALSGSERTERVVELAEEEGHLTVYHSNTDLDALIEAFEDEYDIEVDATRANSETVLQKVLAERKSGDLGADIIENPLKENIIASQQGFFSDYESEYRDAVRDEARMDGWTANYFNVFVVGWNGDSVSPSEVPEEIKDFADPRWKGRVALEIGDVDWFAAISSYYLDHGMTQDEVDAMWQGIADNATVEKGHAQIGDMLSSGKLEVALSIYQHTIDGAAIEDGAPVEWNPSGHHVGPVVISPTGAGLVTTAEHPAAAVLFMDFMLSEEGQQVMADNFRTGSVPSDDSPIEGVETIPMPLDEITDNLEYWDDRYRDLVGG